MPVLYQLLKDGGEITWVIFVFGAISLVLIVERALSLHRAQIHVPEFLRGVLNILRRGNVLEAVSICDDTPGPVAKVVRAPLMHAGEGERAREQAVKDASLAEIPRLEKNLRLLLAIGYLAPLLGLLGTVIGLYDLFETMSSQGNILDLQGMAGPLRASLISTTSGLAVAIPAIGFYSHFRARVENILLDMEKAASEVLFYLSEHPLELENADRGATPAEEAVEEGVSDAHASNGH